MSFIAALLPVAIYLAVVYSIDRFAIVSLRRLLMLVLCGVVTAVVCFAIFQLYSLIQSHLNVSTSQHLNISALLRPLIEELMKALPLLVLARRKKIVFFIDSVICGAAVGGGFCLVENLLYLFGGLGFGTALFRGLEVALIHMGCSGIIAAGLMFAVRIIERRRSRLEIKRKDIWMTILFLVSAPSIHILHNALLSFDLKFSFLNFQLFQLASVFGLMGGLLVWTWEYDSRMIRRWLDRGLDKQLELIFAIREGHLDQTPTGRYLLAVKEAFPPEVFFDLICYVQLHIELSVVAKSRFLFREEGMDYHIDEDRRRTIVLQCEEYSHLERSLGTSARMTVAPLLKFYPADRKALADLLNDCLVMIKK